MLHTSISIGIGYWVSLEANCILHIGCLAWYRSNPSY